MEGKYFGFVDDEIGGEWRKDGRRKSREERTTRRANAHIHTHTYTHSLCRMHSCPPTAICKIAHTRTHTHTHVHRHKYTHTDAHSLTHTDTRGCTQVNARTHACHGVERIIYLYPNTHIRRHTRMRTHAHASSPEHMHTHTHTHTGLTLATALSAYSICTNLPEGLKVVNENSEPLLILAACR
jgi:hypothetical protein